MEEIKAYFTGDGSVGLYSIVDGDVYHSYFGALSESYEKFVIPSCIASYMKNDSVALLDICTGIGYNSKSFLNYILKNYFVSSFYKKNNLKNDKKLIFKNIDIETIYTNNIFVKFFKKMFGKNNINEKIKENIKSDTSSLKVKTLNDDIKDDKNNEFNKKIKIKIDAIDINKDLLKISPVIKQQKKINDKNPKSNSIKINQILNKIVYEAIDNSYLYSPIVNIIFINSLIKCFGIDYINDLNKILKKKIISNVFIEKDMLKLTNFYAKNTYKITSRGFLKGFLHNIYYQYISKRYKLMFFDDKNLPICLNFDEIIDLYKKITESYSINLTFSTDDARKMLINNLNTYDIIFLDAFTPSKTPMLWTEEFFNLLYNHLNDDGVLLTYSNSLPVKNAMLKNNFFVGKIFDANGEKIIGTIASKNKNKIIHPLSEIELGAIKTKSGITYHDKNFMLSNSDIINNREIDISQSNLESATKYYKRIKNEI